MPKTTPIYSILYRTADGKTLLVQFTVVGRHYPATMSQPEEWPETDIATVHEFGRDVDCWDELSDEEQNRLDAFLYNSGAYKSAVFI
jgi:hypothetical protein